MQDLDGTTVEGFTISLLGVSIIYKVFSPYGSVDETMPDKLSLLVHEVERLITAPYAPSLQVNLYPA